MYRLGPLELLIILVIVLLLLALFAALIFIAFRVGISTMQASRGKMKKCPYCVENIKAEAVVCRYCGRDLPPPSTQV